MYLVTVINRRSRLRPTMRPRNRVVRSYRTTAELRLTAAIERTRAADRRLWAAEAAMAQAADLDARLDAGDVVDAASSEASECLSLEYEALCARGAAELAVAALRAVVADQFALARASATAYLTLTPTPATHSLPPPDPGHRLICRRLPGVPQTRPLVPSVLRAA